MSAHGYGRPEQERPRWRSQLLLAVALIIVLVIGGAVYLLYRAAHRPISGGVSQHLVLVAPRCPAQAGSAPLQTAAGGSVKLAHPLTAIAVTSDGRYSFAAMGHHIDVLRNVKGTPSPHPVQVIKLAGAARGEVLTRDDRYLVVAAGEGVGVISVRAAVHPALGNPVLGQLGRPGRSAKTDATAVAVSADGGFAFVALKTENLVAVFNLKKAEAGRFSQAAYAGAVPSADPVAIAASPDGNWLYVANKSQDTLSVLSQHAAEVSPNTAFVSSAKAGCSPSQVLTSPDGRTVWVTARDSNALVGFSAAKLPTDSKHALVAVVPVGRSPVGEALVNGGQDIVTLDVSGFVPGGGNLAVVSTVRALSGARALLRLVKTPLLPRQASVELTSSAAYLLVSFNQSRELQAINTAGLS